MNESVLDIKSIQSYWLEEADEALTVADHLFEKKDYSYALFFGHLAIEKMIKALHVLHKKEHAPPIHNLPRLARLAGISLNEKQKESFVLISTFNIDARYPDLKRAFRKKCTRGYAMDQMKTIKKIFQWLQEMTP